MHYRVQESFWEDFDQLPAEIKKKVRKVLRLFPENTRYPSFETHRIKGTRSPKRFEGYVDKKYRFTFHYEKNKLVFRRVGDHSIVDIESRG
jgi:mRNA-degrading endonuclease YafQ of YafQ-DinJ toxin-antitoxin module